MYKTKPMHITEQSDFFNAAILIETQLDEVPLLKCLKKIEERAGRNFAGQRWGPRPLDMDIIFYNDHSVSLPELTIPHPRWRDRWFVKRPVMDLIHSEAEDAGLKVQHL